MNNQWKDNANRLVVWGDGTYDTARVCSECGDPSCKYPVHPDRYKEIGQTRLEANEPEKGLNYWNWLASNKTGVQDTDGEMIYPESKFANPDCLEETPLHTSGVTEDQYAVAQEAFDKLSGKQKEVWQLVMREQMSQTDAAIKLEITQSTLKTHLNRAKTAYTNYLRSKQNDIGVDGMSEL